MKQPTFYCIRNVSAEDAFPCQEPWTWDSSKVPWHLSKEDGSWDAYLRNGATDHRLFSMCEGLIDGVRTGKENPVCYVHGLCADYDGAIPSDIAEILLKKAPSAFLPQYAVVTKSDKLRLVWVFETPLRVTGDDHARAILDYVKAKVKAEKWFAGYDRCSTEVHTYQCVGKRWIAVAQDRRLPAQILQLWSHEVFCRREELAGPRTKSQEIPMADLRAAARNRTDFGKVPDRFEVGAHCCRFWDKNSDNERGCLITKTGVMVFVPHDKPFMRWADIFGAAFVAQYESEKFSAVASDIWFEGDTGKFWAPDATGLMMGWSKGDMIMKLKVAGFDARTPKGETSSEVEQVLCRIQTEKRVDMAVDYLYYPQTAFKLGDKSSILNVSRIEVVPPGVPQADASAPWDSDAAGRGWPFIHGLVKHMFGDTVPDGGPSQGLRFLWWLSSFYRSGYERNGRAGQALFIAGTASQGKTFLTSQVITRLMGGKPTCATEHLTGMSKWTSDLAGQPVFAVDDDSGVVNRQIHERFTLLLKRYVANAEVPFAKKHGAETTVPWFGRIVVTCNTDPRSLRIIPDLGHSNADKVLMLLARSGSFYQGFSSDRAVNAERVRQELPVLARYLLDLEIPEEYRDQRFGAKGWAHPALVGISDGADSISSLVEFLDLAFKGLNQDSGKILAKTTGGEPGYYCGSAQSLYNAIAGQQPSFQREYTSSRPLGRDLLRMHEKGWDVVPVDDGTRVKKWRIAYDVASKGPTRDRAQAAAGDAFNSREGKGTL